jgi:outer membrane immunogenic protein
MKTILSASVAALALAMASMPANAADFVGGYWGIDVGYGMGDANSEHFGAIGGPLLSTQDDADVEGGILGVHVGHNWGGGGSWVFGLEAGVRYEGIEGDDNFDGGDNNELSTEWEGSIQAKIGTIVNPTMMVYLTGGWSWLSADSNVTDLGEEETVSEVFSGWTAGAGIEFGLSPDANMRVQYRYSDYGEEVLTFAGNGYDMAVAPAIHELTVGLNIEF